MTSAGAAIGPSGEDRWRPKSYHGQSFPWSLWLHPLAHFAESSQFRSHFQPTRRRNSGLGCIGRHRVHPWAMLRADRADQQRGQRRHRDRLRSFVPRGARLLLREETAGRPLGRHRSAERLGIGRPWALLVSRRWGEAAPDPLDRTICGLLAGRARTGRGALS